MLRDEDGKWIKGFAYNIGILFALSLWLNYGQFTMALLWHGMRGIGGLSLKRTPDLRL